MANYLARIAAAAARRSVPAVRPPQSVAAMPPDTGLFGDVPVEESIADVARPHVPSAPAALTAPLSAVDRARVESTEASQTSAVSDPDPVEPPPADAAPAAPAPRPSPQPRAAHVIRMPPAIRFAPPSTAPPLREMIARKISIPTADRRTTPVSESAASAETTPHPIESRNVAEPRESREPRVEPARAAEIIEPNAVSGAGVIRPDVIRAEVVRPEVVSAAMPRPPQENVPAPAAAIAPPRPRVPQPIEPQPQVRSTPAAAAPQSRIDTPRERSRVTIGRVELQILPPPAPPLPRPPTVARPRQSAPSANTIEGQFLDRLPLKT